MLQSEKDPISRSEKAPAGCKQLGCREAKLIQDTELMWAYRLDEQDGQRDATEPSWETHG